MKAHRRAKAELVRTGQIEHTGRFVRAPASDRIKIPKGKKVFLNVSERNHRKDGKPENDLYASSQYQMVYIPPNFRARIFAFILLIWLFAAVTGVGFTIIPLLFGRRMFQGLIPEHIRPNDIYAFSIGIYVLGTVAYCLLRMRWIWKRLKSRFDSVRRQHAEGIAMQVTVNAIFRGLKLLYAYFFLLIVFPLTVSLLVELYILMPLNTHMNPPTAASIQASKDEPGNAGTHTVSVMQAWTLGLLYLKLGSKAVVYLTRHTRLAVAVRVILYRGWLRPNIGVLTRAFVIPGMALAALAIFGPPMVTSFLISNGVFASGQPVVNEAAEAARIAIIYRQAYPVAAFTAVLVRNVIGTAKVFNTWTAKIRDEAYLIGERLHNFGAATAGSKKGRGAWRARGARL